MTATVTTHARELYGTEHVSDEPAELLEQRLGRCYELAAYALALGTAPPDAILIHGSIHGLNAPERIDHAWLVLVNGDVWEPASAMIWHPHAWNVIATPWVHRAYTAREVRAEIVAAGHWGPWDANGGTVDDDDDDEITNAHREEQRS